MFNYPISLSLVLLSVVACVPQMTNSRKVAPSPTLRVTVDRGDLHHITGSAQRGSEQISFVAEYDTGTKRALLVLSDRSHELIRQIIFPGGSQTLVLGDKCTIRTTVQDTEENISYKGNCEILAKVLDLPSLALLPELSKKLAENYRLNGDVSPALLALHRLAMSVANKRPETAKGLTETLKTRAPCDMNTGSCDSNGCYGMCGNGCSCWDWVCFDCCCHIGCRNHDSQCRDCSAHPEHFWNCAACYSPWALEALDCGSCFPECVPPPSPPTCPSGSHKCSGRCCGDISADGCCTGRCVHGHEECP